MAIKNAKDEVVRPIKPRTILKAVSMVTDEMKNELINCLIDDHVIKEAPPRFHNVDEALDYYSITPVEEAKVKMA